MQRKTCPNCKEKFTPKREEQKYCSFKCYIENGGKYEKNEIIKKLLKALGKKSMTPGAIGKKIGIHNTTAEKYLLQAATQGLIEIKEIPMGGRKIKMCRRKK